MMGRAHALSGACIYSLAATTTHPTPAQYALGMTITAGAAVLPDIDHPNSGISQTFGPATRGFAWMVAKVSGGHRNGTHSNLGAGIITMLAFGSLALYAADRDTALVGLGLGLVLIATGYGIGVTDPTPGRGAPAYKELWHGYASLAVCLAVLAALVAAAALYGPLLGAGLMFALMTLLLAAAVRVLHIDGIWDDLAPIPVALALLYYDVDLTVVPYAITMGVLVHIAGDMITEGGCPVGWPWSQTMRGPQVMLTGGPGENFVVMPALAAAWGAAMLVTWGLPGMDSSYLPGVSGH
jgi:membrane-bound metal-dependent hydrolase YbcI (DUF457 family)